MKLRIATLPSKLKYFYAGPRISTRVQALVPMLGLLFVVACSPIRKFWQSKNSDVEKFLTLRIAMGNDPYVLDPQSADTGAGVFLLRQMVATLLKYDANGKVTVDDAENYAWSDSGKTIAIQLKPELRWSDGVAITACQYREGLLRALDPKFTAPLADLLFDIENASARKAGKVGEAQVGITCIDDRTLKLKVTQAYSAKILNALTYVVAAPFRKDREAILKERWLSGNGSRPAISSGAFVLSTYEIDRVYWLKARRIGEPTLSGLRRAQVDMVQLPIVREPLTALALYESGALDIVPELPVALMPKLAKRADFHSYPSATTYMIGFSLKANPVLRDKRVRRAMALAAHQSEIPQLLGGHERAAFAWVPPVLAGGASDFSDPFDAAAAQKLLTEAGFRAGKKFPVLKLFYNGGERHQLLMERVAHNFKEHLGVTVQLEPIEWKVLVAQLKNRAPDMYRYAWTSAYLDPVFFLELFQSDNPNNFGGWKNAEYDRLVTELNQTPLEKRDATFFEKMRRAQQILVVEDPALIPIYHYTKNFLMRPNLRGLDANPQGTWDLASVFKL